MMGRPGMMPGRGVPGMGAPYGGPGARQGTQGGMPSGPNMMAGPGGPAGGPGGAGRGAGNAPAGPPGGAGGKLNPSALANADPTQQKQMIGEKIFPLVQAVEPRLAGKITGMLLEMDNTELLHLIESSSALMNKINEALNVLKSYNEQQSAPA